MKRTARNRFFISACLSSVFLAWLLSVVFIPTGFAPNKDSVYCPLQKIWVKRTPENKPVWNNPLDRICMSDEKKQILTVKILSKKAFAIDEQGIFETLQTGEKVLDKYREFPHSPEQNLARVQHLFTTLTNKNEIKIVANFASEIFSLQQLSRPPTVQNESNFSFRFVRELDDISRNINPRSPPFSI